MRGRRGCAALTCLRAGNASVAGVASAAGVAAVSSCRPAGAAAGRGQCLYSGGGAAAQSARSRPRRRLAAPGRAAAPPAGLCRALRHHTGRAIPSSGPASAGLPVAGTPQKNLPVKAVASG